ncbi:rhodanese-like domain-containing protein [Heliobacterium undosum]|uniref:Rhodanese-like domain-containing protein n=1 Tax=Heliomicrobium undosum TaxID=121734 RepID=A0A845L101_9FIRM|nr:rhodanese-like domain-containing protein [Heliomicrobium undosum]MZP30167.1 rhodanese-like domain-containing protein [Heliomicrobium undosum]
MDFVQMIATAAIGAIVIWLAARYFFGSGSDIHYEEAVRILADREQSLLLDVRTAREHGKRRPVGALNIPVQELKQRLAELEPHRKKQIVVICASGMRSRMAVQTLQKQGFAGVKNFRGGMSGWRGEVESG